MLIRTTLWASGKTARLGRALVDIATNGIAIEVNPHPAVGALLPPALFVPATPHA